MARETKAAPDPIFRTWGEWYAFIPVVIGFAIAVICGITTFIGFFVFVETMVSPGFSGALVAITVLLSVIPATIFPAHFLAHRVFKNRMLRTTFTAIGLALALAAFVSGVMISLDHTDSTRKFLFGMTIESTPAFLVGYLGIGFVIFFQDELRRASEKDSESKSRDGGSLKSATIISLADRSR